MKPTLKALLKEAPKLEKAGIKLGFKNTSEFYTPEQFKNILKKMPVLKNAFEALTPIRQSPYLLYFAALQSNQKY